MLGDTGGRREATVWLERPSEAAAPGGWGLWIVDDLTHRWGIRRGTARVWFEMPPGIASPAA
jgi:hypothetical protein